MSEKPIAQEIEQARTSFCPEPQLQADSAAFADLDNWPRGWFVGPKIDLLSHDDLPTICKGLKNQGVSEINQWVDESQLQALLQGFFAQPLADKLGSLFVRWRTVFSQAETRPYAIENITVAILDQDQNLFGDDCAIPSRAFHCDREPRVANATYFLPAHEGETTCGTEVLNPHGRPLIEPYRQLVYRYPHSGIAVYRIPLGQPLYFRGDDAYFEQLTGFNRSWLGLMQDHLSKNVVRNRGAFPPEYRGWVPMRSPATIHRTPIAPWKGTRITLRAGFVVRGQT